MSETRGYNPNDTIDRRIMKASFFVKSMIKKGQETDTAYQIASRYYRVPEKSVRDYDEQEMDDDTYFFINGAILIAASEIFDPGDFF